MFDLMTVQAVGSSLIAAGTSSSTVASFTDILSAISEMVTWITTTMTTFTTWILGNNLAMMYLSIFIAGIAIAFLFRILRSV